MKLTGRTRYRAGWFGRLIVQVEYAYRGGIGGGEPATYIDWRDARIEDFPPPLLDPRIAEVAIVVPGSSKPANLA